MTARVGAGAGDGFNGQRVGHVVTTAAALTSSNGDAHQAERQCLANQVGGKRSRSSIDAAAGATRVAREIGHRSTNARCSSVSSRIHNERMKDEGRSDEVSC